MWALCLQPVTLPPGGQRFCPCKFEIKVIHHGCVPETPALLQTLQCSASVLSLERWWLSFSFSVPISQPKYQTGFSVRLSLVVYNGLCRLTSAASGLRREDTLWTLWDREASGPQTDLLSSRLKEHLSTRWADHPLQPFHLDPSEYPH